MREENFGTSAGVHLMWGPLNTGFTLKQLIRIYEVNDQGFAMH